MAARRSYPLSEVRGGGREELPCVRGQWQLGGDTLHPRFKGSGQEELHCVRGQGWWLKGATLRPTSVVAGRRHPASKVRGSGREGLHRVRGQGRPGEATSRLRPGAVTLRSHPKPEARGSSCEEPPMPEAEEQPKQWWLRRHRRA